MMLACVSIRKALPPFSQEGATRLYKIQIQLNENLCLYMYYKIQIQLNENLCLYMYYVKESVWRHQMMPCPIMACATFMNPAMLAPFT